MKIVLTGATGFVGGSLLEILPTADVFVLGRSIPEGVDGDHFFQSEIDSESDYSEALQGAGIVVHSAARAHIMDDRALDPLTEYRVVNTKGTLNLARQAAAAGVKRFVFVSTAKVNGESTPVDLPFRADDSFVPADPYALSKFEAEVGLREIALQAGMEYVIVRPPLVYGPGVKANFETMMRWVKKGVPLPLGGVRDNRRSLVSLDNLVDFIVVCMQHPKAANEIFLVSDNDDMSTAELLGRMARALAVANRALPVPVSWIKFAAKLIGKPAIAERLCSSLCVDVSKAKSLLGWQPPYSVEQGLKKTAAHYLQNKY